MTFDELMAELVNGWRQKAAECQGIANDPTELPLQRQKMTTRASVLRCCAEELDFAMDRWDMDNQVDQQ